MTRNPALILALALLAAVPSVAGERENRLDIVYERRLPPADETPGPATRPLMVYVVTDRSSRDQVRFDDVVMKNESLRLAAKLFACVEAMEETARAHPIFRDLSFTAPCVVAFDSTRTKRAMAGGRASGAKVYSTLVKIAQYDYEGSPAGAVRAAKNLLATFDQIDAARSSLEVKRNRYDDAREAGSTEGRKLIREIEAEQAAIDARFEKTLEKWRKIWALPRKPREEE